MTPGARVAAAIICLDAILAGAPAEQVLTSWGRQNRYAGSKDRAAVRDLVFSGLRRRRSAAWAGGAATETGWAVMLGLCRQEGWPLADLFSGVGHAPPPPADGEAPLPPDTAPPAVKADMPDWLWQRLSEDLGPDAAAVAAALRHRAPLFLRVNLGRTDRASAGAALAADGVVTRPHPDVRTALEVVEGASKLQTSTAFSRGLVEPQDAASQAAVLRLPLSRADRVLDYCAGGGGKALAIAALGAGAVLAHDADPARMADLPARAARAGVRIDRIGTADLARAGPFDLVVADAPCSGSGTWRRSPDARWRLTAERLAALIAIQRDILESAASRVRPGGALAYMTCSVLKSENAAQADGFLARHPDWRREDDWSRLPDDLGDGFHLSLLRRPGPRP